MEMTPADWARLRVAGRRVAHHRDQYPLDSPRWTIEAQDRDVLWQALEYLTAGRPELKKELA